MPELTQIRQELERRLETLQARLSKIDAHLHSPGERDSGEAAVQRENDEVLERLSDAETREVDEIRSALGRISAGTYGSCMSCKEPIAPARLEAIPTAPLCIGCAR